MVGKSFSGQSCLNNASPITITALLMKITTISYRVNSLLRIFFNSQTQRQIHISECGDAGEPRGVAEDCKASPALDFGCTLESSGELLKFLMSRLQANQNLWRWPTGLSTFQSFVGSQHVFEIQNYAP